METYDLALSWDKNKCFFTDTLISICEKKNLSFLWVTENNIRATIKKLHSNQMRIGVMLDTEATYDVPEELYSRLNYAVKDSGGVVINDPDRTRIAVDKAVMYYELLDSGIETPYTVIVRNWEPLTFKLSAEERKKLGVPFIIKPGCGWGHRGVVYNARGTIKEIATARNFDRGDNFLLQEKVYPIELDGKRAWFRIFHIFDEIIPCWWDDRTSCYEHVSIEDFEKYKLYPLVRIVTRIGNMTKMVWFSTEIAIERKAGKQRILTIDYVNDQCDMEAASESKDGVPDGIVKLTAYSIAHTAEKLIKKIRENPKKKYTVLLYENSRLSARGLGYSPSLLRQDK
ncbi:MAG: hypothetical protein ABH869_04845 [Candidatus Omnitrophota bacterium]